MTPSVSEVSRWRGKTLRDAAGDKLGTIDDAYMDRDTDTPSFVAINTGLFGLRSSLAPIDGIQADGDELVAPFAKATLKDAPSVDADGELSADDEDQLFDHYERRAQYTTPGHLAPAEATPVDSAPVDPAPENARATSPESDDQTMTLSQEEVHVGTRMRATGRARLRKVIVTENLQVTVPVRREEVRVEYDGIEGEPPA